MAWLLYPVVALLAATAVGGMVTTVGDPVDGEQYPMPGRAYTVNGHRVHLMHRHRQPHRRPRERSRPQLAGLGPHHRAVGTTTRVCAYDRAGQGWSEDPDAAAGRPRGRQRPPRAAAAAGETGPFVLAGHSAGGAYAMTYAARTPMTSPAWCCSTR